MSSPGRKWRRTMKAFYSSRGEGPWVCHICWLPIFKLGQRTWDGNVHHLDGDYTNDDPHNLDVAHTICHLRQHSPTDEMKAQISKKLRGRPSPTRGMKMSDVTRRRMSEAQQGERNSFHGRVHTDETRRKMRQPRQRIVCEQCGVEYAINWLERHRTEGRCA